MKVGNETEAGFFQVQNKNKTIFTIKQNDNMLVLQLMHCKVNNTHLRAIIYPNHSRSESVPAIEAFASCSEDHLQRCRPCFSFFGIGKFRKYK